MSGYEVLSFECEASLCLSVVAVGCAIGIMETQAIDDQDYLVNYDNDNENDDLGYHSEEYFDEAREDDENNHSNGNVVKRGITRLYKFRREYGKPDGIKLSVTFDTLNWISGKHRALFSSFLGDMVREHIGLKIPSWKKVDSEARDKLWDEITVSPVDINLINSSADEEDGTTVVGCENDTSIQKSNKTSPCETIKSVRSKKLTRSIRKDSSRQDSQSQENVSPLLVLPQDCYKVSVDTSLMDAAYIPDVVNNGFKTVKDAVGGFFAWPKDHVVFDPKATPPSTIQMNVENKTAPKLQTKRKNVYVSSDAMQRQAKKKSLQKSLSY
ncbi:hypothetical protein Tco_1403376 [Tanacetum coccineum]